MGYDVKLHRDIEKQLLRIPKTDVERMAETMRSFHNDPRPPGCRKIDDSLYRVRDGSYRIIYGIFDDEKVVVVCKVARRTEATYRDLDRLARRAKEMAR